MSISGCVRCFHIIECLKGKEPFWDLAWNNRITTNLCKGHEAILHYQGEMFKRHKVDIKNLPEGYKLNSKETRLYKK